MQPQPPLTFVTLGTINEFIIIGATIKHIHMPNIISIKIYVVLDNSRVILLTLIN